MSSINIRVDEKLKKRSYAQLEKLGVTPSELLRQTLQYVADSGQLPFSNRPLTPEDDALLATARARLQKPQRVKVSLDEL